MGIPENHPAILEALKRGLILPPPGAAAAPAPEEPEPPLVAASWGGFGDPALCGLSAVVPLRTVSEANARGWRGKSRRTHAARLAVAKVLGRCHRWLGPLAAHYHAGGPLDVVLTRLGGRALDRTVNLPSAMKATEDVVCLFLAADDGDPRWRCRCEQEPGGRVGVRITIAKAEKAQENQ